MNVDMRELTSDELRELVEDAHINFLLGAGASSPMFRLLGDVENILTALEGASDGNAKHCAKAAVYAGFFKSVVLKNRELLDRSTSANRLLGDYQTFLQTINRLLLLRRSSILNKRVNLFTTNIDVAIEVASEALQLELNDGFSGTFTRRFSTSNFGSVISRRSLQYDNLSEIPTFNLLKLHGSVSWATHEKALSNGEMQREIVFDHGIENVMRTSRALDEVSFELPQLTSDTTAESLLTTKNVAGNLDELRGFLEAYTQLAIVNPTKSKFQQTVLNQNYYDLLRIFTNELEKENAVLFVIGFSCRDEHIRELMIRAARFNPTLQIIIFAYDSKSANDIAALFSNAPITNGNIRVVGPQVTEAEASKRYDLKTITSELFGRIAPIPPSRQPQVVEVKVALSEPMAANNA